MTTAISKHFNHYQSLYLFTIILFGGGFFYGIIATLLKQPIFLFQSELISHIISLDNILHYMYFVLFIYFIISLQAIHVLGVIFISLIIFVYGIHNGVYLIHVIEQFSTLFSLIIEIFFILMQWGSIVVFSIGCIEISINIMAVSFFYKESIKLSEVCHQYMNFGFVSLFILFLSIILKTYLLRI